MQDRSTGGVSRNPHAREGGARQLQLQVRHGGVDILALPLLLRCQTQHKGENSCIVLQNATLHAGMQADSNTGLGIDLFLRKLDYAV